MARQLVFTVSLFFIFLSCFFYCLAESDLEPGIGNLEAYRESFREIFSQRTEYLKTLEKTNPKVFKKEMRLVALEQEIEKISKEYREGKLNELQAQEKMRPLIKEEVVITADIDYQTETQLTARLAKIKPRKD